MLFYFSSVRPCSHMCCAFAHQWGRCKASSYLSPVAVRLVHQGCVSTRRHRMRYCGQCADAGRCCTPYRTRTVPVSFRCLGGGLLRRHVMVIDSCACHHHCQRAASGPVSPHSSSGGGSPYMWGGFRPRRWHPTALSLGLNE